MSTPSDMVEKAIQSAIIKTSIPINQLVIRSFQAGMYIAFGALFASIVATGMQGVWPYGIMKVLQGVTFSLGLILVVIGGAELFTGNSLMIMAYAQKKISLGSLLKNWFIVYLGNFAGSLIIALLVCASREYLVNNSNLGYVFIATAVNKTQYGFGQAFVLGILCNTLVCLAVWLTLSGKSIVDKIIAIIFPITAFIAAGFEHSVANMYIIPLGILINQFDPAFVINSGIDVYTLSWNIFFLRNLLPVTLGNIVGGVIFVGLLYLWGHSRVN